MASDVFNQIRASNDSILDAVRFAAVWIAYADHQVDSDELATLQAMVPDRLGGVKFNAMIVSIPRQSRGL